MDFFQVLKIDMNEVQINLGPNVGDMTITYDPPRRGRVIPMAVFLNRAQEDINDGGS